MKHARKIENVLIVISVLFMAWLFMSWLDVVVHAETEHYSMFNAFELLIRATKWWYAR